MANSDRFDELFRRAFQRVDVPEPPELDWRALARASARGRNAGALADRVWGASLAAGVVAVITLLFYSGSSEPRTDRAPARRSAEMMTGVDAASTPARASGTEQGASGDLTSTHERSSAPEMPTIDAPARTHNKTIAITEGTGRTKSEGPSRVERHSKGAASDPSMARVSKASSAGAAREQVDAYGPGVRGRSLEGLAFLDLIPMERGAGPRTPRSSVPAETAMPGFAHWAVSPWVSLDHTSYADAHEGNDEALDELRMDRGLTGSVGARVSYSFDERLTVYTGIQWAWKGALKGTIRTSAYQHADYDLSGQYLEIPLGFRFTAPRERWSFYARGGALFQFNLQPGRDNIVIYDMAAKEMSTLRLASNSMGIAGEFAAGLEFRVRRGLSMFIEPVYRAGFTPVVQHPSFTGLPLNPREQTLGLATGIVYQFRSHR